MSHSPDSDDDDRVVIGIDVGTTATKVVGFRLDGAPSHVEERFYPTLHPEPGWAEQEPDALLAATREALKECLIELGPVSVLGVGVSAAMHGLLGLDEGGAPLTPVLIWADSRAVDEVESLRASGLDRELHSQTGTPVHPMSPLVKVMWFAANEPELFARVAHWVSLKTWILHGLTGELVCDLSSASDSGMLDRASGGWHPTALGWAGLKEAQLPPIVPTTHVLHLSDEVGEFTGLPLGTPVVVGAGDGPMGNLGTDAMQPGVVGVSIGTSAAARAVVQGPVTDLPPGLFCYALADDLWVVGGAASNGGSASRWMVDLLAGENSTPSDQTGALTAAAKVVPGSDGLCVVPYWGAERAPLWDIHIPGALLGLRLHHSRAHIVRATV